MLKVKSKFFKTGFKSLKMTWQITKSSLNMEVITFNHSRKPLKSLKLDTNIHVRNWKKLRKGGKMTRRRQKQTMRHSPEGFTIPKLRTRVISRSWSLKEINKKKVFKGYIEFN